MQTVYVNRNTGEIFNAEEVSLANLCDGMVNEQFIRDLNLLASRMLVDDKGSITIKIACEKTYNGEGEEVLNIGAQSVLDLPKVKMLDNKQKNVGEDGMVVDKMERQDLFSNLPELPGADPEAEQ